MYVAVIFIKASSVKKMVGGCRQRLESDTSIQSLPADLERVISVCDNDLSASKASFRASVDSTLSSGSDEAFLSMNTSVMQITDAVPTSVNEAHISCSSRESLFDGSELQNTQGQVDHQRMSLGGSIDLQMIALQQRARATSSDSTEQRNRTMLIQVSQHELSLISLDRKTVIFERHFKDISFCSQVSQNEV